MAMSGLELKNILKVVRNELRTTIASQLTPHSTLFYQQWNNRYFYLCFERCIIKQL